MRQLIGVAAGAIAGALIVGGIVVATGQISAAPDPRGLNEIASNGNVQGRLYPGDPEAEAMLVSAEETRLDSVRTITSAAEFHFVGAANPYRMETGARTTLVLTPRVEPYTLLDLAALLPESLLLQRNGSLLLTESVVILNGATLDIGGTAPITLLLDSTPESFVSIISLGGVLDVTGTLRAPVTVSSWNSLKNAPDTVTEDGRSYIRAIGGTVDLAYAWFDDLGFWSGNTGGVAITGSESLIADSAASQVEASTTGGAPVLPTAEVDAFTRDRVATTELVSASVEQVSFERNAYGLFITDAADVTITGSAITDSLIDGLVLHRNVTDAVISDTTATGNAVDGIAVSRSSENLKFRNVTASDNGRNGLSIDGEALADGPSASGSSVLNYGDSRVTGSTFADNGRYGLELIGGHDIIVSGSTLKGNDIGVVASAAAAQLTITDNTFTDQVRQAIAIRDGGVDAMISGNTIVGGDTGVYVRNAQATIEGNTLSAITNHGITLVGSASGVQIHDNSIGGNGTTAIYRDDAAVDATVSGNRTLDWRPAVTPTSVTKSLFQPLTLVWLSLALIALITAVLRSRRSGTEIIDPYANVAPLSSFTRGIVVSPERGGN